MTSTTYVLTTKSPTKRGNGYRGVTLPGAFRNRQEIDAVIYVDHNGRFAQKNATGRFAKFYPGTYPGDKDAFFQSVEEKITIPAKVVKELKAAIPEGGLTEALSVTIEN